jgi:chemotaxis protein methyltransferase CheR
LRRHVEFAHLNLGVDELPAPERGMAEFDLILCRNVLVYLDARAVCRIARQLFACLADGGWLLTSPTDPPLWKYAPFESLITPAGVAYRRSMADAKARKNEATPVAVVQDQVKKPVADASADRACAPDSRKALGSNSAKTVARQIRERLDQGETREAARIAQQGSESHPLSAELHFLQGLCHMAHRETDAAAAALRRVAYLDGTLAAAQFFLGVCLKDSDQQTALRALENALLFCLSRPPRERVALMPDATAGHLAERTRREIGEIQQHWGSNAR